MSDERNPVICPWCGKEMELDYINMITSSGRKTECVHFYACPQCHSQKPRADSEESAYEAAALKPVDENTSDEYHTYKELYHHRAVLFAALIAQMPDKAWKSKTHSDGSVWDGWFIVGIETPDGQATYHYAIEPYWNMFCCQELERAPEWDGHTPAQAIERIELLAKRPLNRPLTLLELFDLDPESDAVWVCDSSWNPIIAMSAENACEWASDADTVLFFARKPTIDDIEAARAEKGEQT